MFDDFLREYPDVESLVKADPKEIISKYRQLGLPKRIYWLVESMKIIVEKHDGKIPSNKNELLQLPGIGEYTSSAILCFAFNQKVEIMDSNVLRIFTCYYGIPKNKIKNKARSILPLYNWKNYNEALLDFSAVVCKKKHYCEKCPLSIEK